MDFLGNPFGLLSDVTSGVSGVMTSGNLPGLVTQVAHGLSDTASKVSARCHYVRLINLDMYRHLAVW